MNNIQSDDLKAKLNIASKKRMANKPPWNKGLNYKSTGRPKQKTCGIRFMKIKHFNGLPTVFHGMNTAPRD